MIQGWAQHGTLSGGPLLQMSQRLNVWYARVSPSSASCSERFVDSHGNERPGEVARHCAGHVRGDRRAGAALVHVANERANQVPDLAKEREPRGHRSGDARS